MGLQHTVEGVLLRHDVIVFFILDGVSKIVVFLMTTDAEMARLDHRTGFLPFFAVFVNDLLRSHRTYKILLR